MDFEKMTNRKFSYCKGINGHYEIALSVENYAAVDRVFAETVAAGAGSVMEPATEPWGKKTCYIAEPNAFPMRSFFCPRLFRLWEGQP